MNYYELLQVSKDANSNEIKKQYYKLAKEYHPDKTSGDKDKNSKFIEIQQAYNVLIDETKRRVYDSSMYEDELFENIAQFFSYDYVNVDAPKRSKEVCETLHISIPEYLNGINRKQCVKRERECETCNKTGIKDYKHNTRRCSYCNGTGLDLNIPIFACGVCNGKCINVINDIPCDNCQGTSMYTHEDEILIIADSLLKSGSIIEKGGYKFKVKYSFDNEISDDSSLLVNENISVIRWLCGGISKVQLYDDTFVNVTTLGAFDLSKEYEVCKNVKIRFGLTMVKKHIEMLRKCSKVFVSLFRRNVNTNTSTSTSTSASGGLELTI